MSLHDSTPVVRRLSRRARSRVSNGAVFLENVDGRSIVARRYRDILGQLISDAGGDPSEAQGLLMRRAATLGVWCEMKEAGMARGEPLDIAEFTAASNCLRRLLYDLGLQRVPRDVTSFGELLRADRAIADAS
jgi:hypothetical protein